MCGLDLSFWRARIHFLLDSYSSKDMVLCLDLMKLIDLY
uniref:Uncharacterized protein n=1 Tax=Rhizophora mucronata TaxID=61149 RepID=A0A2P2Q9U3_RHIMU